MKEDELIILVYLVKINCHGNANLLYFGHTGSLIALASDRIDRKGSQVHRQSRQSFQKIKRFSIVIQNCHFRLQKKIQMRVPLQSR